MLITQVGEVIHYRKETEISLHAGMMHRASIASEFIVLKEHRF
jgi:hypothetical protein